MHTSYGNLAPKLHHQKKYLGRYLHLFARPSHQKLRYLRITQKSSCVIVHGKSLNDSLNVSLSNSQDQKLLTKHWPQESLRWCFCHLSRWFWATIQNLSLLRPQFLNPAFHQRCPHPLPNPRHQLLKLQLPLQRSTPQENLFHLNNSLNLAPQYKTDHSHSYVGELQGKQES